MKKKIEFASLMTPFEKEICEVPFSEYPRPAFKRDSYICLNGKWEFTVCKKSGKKTQIYLCRFRRKAEFRGRSMRQIQVIRLFTKEAFHCPKGSIREEFCFISVR